MDREKEFCELWKKVALAVVSSGQPYHHNNLTPGARANQVVRDYKEFLEKELNKK